MSSALQHDWREDPATFNQRRAIRNLKLASEADLSTMTKGQASALLDKHLKKDQGPQPPSEGQLKFIRDLAVFAGVDPDYYVGLCAKQKASDVISHLQALNLTVVQKLEPGIYLHDGTVVRVRFGSNGRPYADRLTKLDTPEPTSNGFRTHRFERVKGLALRVRPEDRMTKEEAIAFGQEHSVCVNCGKQLDPNIRDAEGYMRYIGPVCEQNVKWRS